VYFEIREKIEQSQTEDRWDFDRKRLFDRTDYMTERCTDLSHITQVLEQFYTILGPELKGLPLLPLCLFLSPHTHPSFLFVFLLFSCDRGRTPN
jgi:hypothetical protein